MQCVVFFYQRLVYSLFVCFVSFAVIFFGKSFESISSTSATIQSDMDSLEFYARGFARENVCDASKV